MPQIPVLSTITVLPAADHTRADQWKRCRDGTAACYVMDSWQSQRYLGRLTRMRTLITPIQNTAIWDMAGWHRLKGYDAWSALYAFTAIGCCN